LITSKRILSTKLLTPAQSELLLATGISLAHFNVLKIKNLEFNIKKQPLEHVIISSSNAIPALLDYKNSVKNVYVVGSKTGLKLEELGFNVAVIKEYSTDLAQHIMDHFKHLHFTFFCGAQRRDELPQALLSTQISFEEVKVYESVMVEKSFDCIFDAVMFYSPRGVHAFAKANPQNLHLAICIGETTATAARMYTQNIKVATKATVENTIVTAVKALLND